MSELEQRARELHQRILVGHRMIGSNPDNRIEKICECGQRFVGLLQHDEHQRIEEEKVCLAALTAAFNEGAGGAYLASGNIIAQEIADREKFDSHLRSLDDLEKDIYALTPADALAAVERRVSEARLELVEELNKQTEIIKQLRKEMKAAGEHIGDLDDQIAQLEAEAAGKEGGDVKT